MTPPYMSISTSGGFPTVRPFPDPFSNPPSGPLSFDRVNENRDLAPSSRTSRLLNLPVEILTKVIGNFDAITDKESLACLALVNRDCRQLARSCQFRSVELDFSSRSTSLVGVLFREGVERSRHQGRTRLPSLGACVRHVTVSGTHYWEQIQALQSGSLSGPGHNYEDNREPMTDVQLKQWRENVSNLSQRKADVYDPSLLFAISTLPHLDVLDLGEFSVDQFVLDSLTFSVCKHLRVTLTIEDMDVQFPALAWQLETLSLDAGWGFDKWYDSRSSNIDASFLWGPILHLCSQSLQTLRMKHQEPPSDKPMEPISFSLDFPQLRFLQISCNLHQTALESLLTDRLTALIVNDGIPAMKDYLDCKGHLRDLSLLFWTGLIKTPDHSSMQMLSKNQQIAAFGIRYARSAASLDRVLSVLESFSHLTHLSMVWDGAQVPESSSRILACLVSLEHLHISAGNQVGWRHDWEISHDSIKSTLSPLEKLKSLLFTRDSYMGAHDPPELQTDYYHMTDFSWSQHFTRMSRYVAAYSGVFPNLQFVFIGQVAFNVGSGAWNDGQRDEEFDVERYMFGI